MTKIKKDYKINDIISLVKDYNDDKVDLIYKSYEYVNNKLKQNILQDALNICYLLTTVQADSETISACILSFLFQNDKMTI